MPNGCSRLTSRYKRTYVAYFFRNYRLYYAIVVSIRTFSECRSKCDRDASGLGLSAACRLRASRLGRLLAEFSLLFNPFCGK